MIQPTPYNEYEKDEIRSILDSLPLSAEGKRLSPGKVVSFVVNHESHTQAPAIVTSAIVAVQRHRVFFEPTMAQANGINGGVDAGKCWLDASRVLDEYESRRPKLDMSA